MNRRELLRHSAMLGGAALTLPMLSSLLSGCGVEGASENGEYQLAIFDDEQFQQLQNLLDMLLPETDSPSATQMDVHYIIDQMVGNVYSIEQRDAYMKDFNQLVRHLEFQKGPKAALLALDKGEVEDVDLIKAYWDLKIQAVSYYLSTEKIGKNYLNYLPVPGSYEPCISLESVEGKAWAI